MSTILVVEDEKKVSALVQKALEQENYKVECAFNGNEGLAIISKKKIDAVVLDILMPEKDGLTMLKELRASGNTIPVLFLSAKGSTEERIEGLNFGADDYLPKPFAISEMLARVRSMLRRSGVDKNIKLVLGNLKLDLVNRKAKRGTRVIELTTKEFSILEYFMRNKNKILSRANICEHIWNYNFDTGTNLVDVYISHLREKVDLNEEKKYFHTIRSVGYILREE